MIGRKAQRAKALRNYLGFTSSEPRFLLLSHLTEESSQANFLSNLKKQVNT